jgi:SagB-type dehydrogenase family enzyme
MRDALHIVVDERAPGVEALPALRAGLPVEEWPRLQQEVRNRAGLAGVAQLLDLIRRAAGERALSYSVGPPHPLYASLTALSANFQLAPPLDDGRAALPHRLSRFACLHRVHDALVLESPAGLANLTLSPPAAALVLRFTESCSLADLIAGAPNQDPASLAGLVRLLLSSEAIVPAGPEDPRLAMWEFHDYLFHTRSRKGRASGAMGGTYHFLGEQDPPPDRPTVAGGKEVPLPRPDANAPGGHEAPFGVVLEQRCSRRAHGADPIRLAHLGEFLYRTARVRRTFEHTVTRDGRRAQISLSSRPYPCGGAGYELDLYLAVARCAGLEPGLYLYDPEPHRLVHRSDQNEWTEELRDDARRATGVADPAFPQVLITYAARFARVQWKYEGLAYALMLKHVGVLQQTMYLVAEAMGLAGCALGSGDSDLFARAAGTDYNACTSVGEFVLGSRAGGEGRG